MTAAATPNATSAAGLQPSEGRFWNQLLELVDEGRVVPIVGQDLLTLNVDGRQVHLYPYLAQRLAEYLEIPGEDLPAAGALHEVACRFLSRGGKIPDFYPALKTTFSLLGRLPLPEPLVQLAEIKTLKLFVTLTFDSLLEQALNEVRLGGKERTGVFYYSLTEARDLEPPKKMQWPAVFHLFGRLSSLQDYAVTDEDTLEIVHSLQSKSRELKYLFAELSRRPLLLIGSNFPDWLARFFLRIPKRERLWIASGKTDVIADAGMREDVALVAFLQHFSTQTEVSSKGAAEFVAELHRRWTERHPIQPLAPEPAVSQVSEVAMERDAVFLSYASEDRPVVEALQKELENVGVDVWFDRKRLKMGVAFEKKIRRNIDRCSLFVPILSRHTLTEDRRFFRTEWDHAEKVAVRVKPSNRFIIPVAIDDIPPDDEGLPERFRDLHWYRLTNENGMSEVVSALKDLFRDYQRSNNKEI